MLKIILTIALILCLLFIVMIDGAACIAAGREDRLFEQFYERWEREHPDLQEEKNDEMEG